MSGRKLPLEIRPQVYLDIKGILKRTEERWGSEQRAKYKKLLDSCLQDIAVNPQPRTKQGKLSNWLLSHEMSPSRSKQSWNVKGCYRENKPHEKTPNKPIVLKMSFWQCCLMNFDCPSIQFWAGRVCFATVG